MLLADKKIVREALLGDKKSCEIRDKKINSGLTLKYLPVLLTGLNPYAQLPRAGLASGAVRVPTLHRVTYGRTNGRDSRHHSVF